jgi:hypothetical protein
VQLSQELFAEITGVHLNAPAPPGVPASAADRRQHRRVLFDQRARIFPLMEGIGEGGSAVLIRDISVMGIGFLAADPIGVGDEFVIRLPTTVDQPIDIHCAARRCELGGTCGSQFAVGATFELVINRSMSSAIAPESEILPEDAAVSPAQSAEPSIEQRFDQQRETSHLVRPIIQQTRMDRWLANPRVQKIHRILKRIFWPVLIVYSAINRLLTVTEQARIRTRLSSSRRGKWKRKGSRPSAAQLLASLPALPESATAQAQQSTPATGEVYTSMFELPANNGEQTKESPTAIPSGSKRVSLFSTGEPVESAPPQSAPVRMVPQPVAEVAAAPQPTLSIKDAAAAEILCQSESRLAESPVIEKPAATIPVTESAAAAPTEAEPAAEPNDSVVMRDHVVEPAPAEQVSSNADARPIDPLTVPSEPQVVALAPEQQIEPQSQPQPMPEPALSFNEPIRSAPAPLKSRPPSPLARHSRRRSRSGYLH